VRRLNDLTEELLGSIIMLLEKRRNRAALILLYSSIDVLGALGTAGGQATRDSFTAWVDTYMDPSSSLSCSSLELYSGRCGVLHTLSSKTRLTSAGTVRQLAYVSGPFGSPQVTDAGGTCVVHVESLWHCFRTGVQRFVADVESDSARIAVVDANFTRLYVTRDRL
jgi:hypothetical protein